MSRRLAVAVVGCGIGGAHADAYKKLNELYDLKVVCDLDEEKAKAVAKDSGAEVATDFAAICLRKDIDLVDLCTPPHLHFGQIQTVLESGKHVVCEKPLVGSIQEVDTLAEMEIRSGRRIIPVFQYRFGRGLQKLRYLMDRGLTGKAFLSTVETCWRRDPKYYALEWRGKWRTELGGAVLGHAIHAHDMLYFILGPAKRVFARTTTRVNQIEVEDCASVSLEMNDGSLATLAVTLGSSREITRHRFCFENLSAESNVSPYSNAAEPWIFTGDTPEKEAAIQEALRDFSEEPEYFLGQFHRLHAALCNSAKLPVALSDARNALELITAIYYSAETGQEVLLPIGPEHPYYASWVPDPFR